MIEEKPTIKSDLPETPRWTPEQERFIGNINKPIEPEVKDLDKEIDFVDIARILEPTIKKDDAAKKITFATDILNYLGDNQTNICFKSDAEKLNSFVELEG